MQKAAAMTILSLIIVTRGRLMSRAHNEIPFESLFEIQDKIIDNKKTQINLIKENESISLALETLIPSFENSIDKLRSTWRPGEAAKVAGVLADFCKEHSKHIYYKRDIGDAINTAVYKSNYIVSESSRGESRDALVDNLRKEIKHQQQEINKVLKPDELKILEDQRDKMIQPLNKLIQKQIKKIDAYKKHLFNEQVPDEKLKQKQELITIVSTIIQNISRLLRKPSKASTQQDYDELKENILALYQEQNLVKSLLPVQRKERGEILQKVGITSEGEDYTVGFNEFLEKLAKQVNIQSAVEADNSIGQAVRRSDVIMAQAENYISANLFELEEKIIATNAEQAVLAEKNEDAINLREKFISVLDEAYENLKIYLEYRDGGAADMYYDSDRRMRAYQQDRTDQDIMDRKIDIYKILNKYSKHIVDPYLLLTAAEARKDEWNQSNPINTLLAHVKSELKTQEKLRDHDCRPLQNLLNKLDAQRNEMIEPLRKIIDKHTKKLEEYKKHLDKEEKKEDKSEISIPLSKKIDLIKKISDVIEKIQSALKKPPQNSSKENKTQLESQIRELYKLTEANETKGILTSRRSEGLKGKFLSRGEGYYEELGKLIEKFAIQAKIKNVLSSEGPTREREGFTHN